MGIQNFLIGWGIFLVVVYAVMAVDALMYNRRARRTYRQVFKILTEDE